MLSVELHKKKIAPEKIKLPKQTSIEELKKIVPAKRSNENLVELCNFDNDDFAFSPPDKNFMKHLQNRMAKV